MKKSIAAATAVAAMLAAASLVAVSSPAEAAVGLHVSNGRLYEANGSELVLRGINHAHTWYTSQTSSFANIGATGANSVRTVLSGGRWGGANSVSDVSNVISLAKQAKLISVLEDHDTTGYNEQSGAVSLDAAADYWISVKSALVGQEDYVILNIGNEPYGNGSSYANWTTDTANAIKKLRNAGIQNTIMVDGPNWGQDWGNVMKSTASQVYAADTTGNTVFSIHMYGVYDTASEVTGYIDTFLNAGLPIVVGEFGNMHSDGNPDEDTIMSYATAKNVGYLGWSWSGNSGGVEYLDLTNSFNPSSLTTWGERLINGANGIKATSKRATIFGGTNPTTTTTTSRPTTTTTSSRPTTTTTTTTPGSKVKIMALGDSITGSPGCWRALLWQKLVQNGFSNIDFVGSLAGQGCGFTYDGENEGHGGYLVTNVASSGDFAGWMRQSTPDVILMHFGTNDVWSSIAPSTILSAYSTIVQQARAVNPNVKFLVAQIIPVVPSTCSECPQRTINLNAAIPAWASGISTSASPVSVVDQWTNWVPSTDTYDGVHPSDPTGITKMANVWYPAVAAVLSGTTPTTTTTTSRPTTTTTTSQPPTTTTTSRPTTTTTTTTSRPTTTTTTSGTGSASVTWTVESSWPGGLQALVKVTNTGTSTINGWTVGATLPAGQTIQQSYNGAFTQSGQQATITNAAYNGTLAPGAFATAGVAISWTTNNGPATNLTLNGSPVDGNPTTTTSTTTSTTTTSRPATTTTTTSRPTTTTTTTARPTTTTTTTTTARPTTTTTTTTTTTARPTTTTTTGGGGTSCSAVISAIGSWGGGWQGEVTVTAGSASVSGWTVSWTFPNGALSSGWNATTSGTTSVTATDVGWNGTLGAGASTSWGFIATGTPSTPTVTCTAR